MASQHHVLIDGLAPVGQREDVDLIWDAALMAGQTHLRKEAACEAVAADGVRDLDITAGGVDGGADAGIVQIALDLTADVVVQQAEGDAGGDIQQIQPMDSPLLEGFGLVAVILAQQVIPDAEVGQVLHEVVEDELGSRVGLEHNGEIQLTVEYHGQ